MIGEISLGGVYIPALVFLGLLALVLFAFVSSLMSILGGYRLFSNRPLVDIALLVILMGAVVVCSSIIQSVTL
ncbi:DUF1656 domain-containing protein [Paraburkholderia sp. BL25I1N1]|uniref:DUF1656 domain-containing protein n=1 Tax=Paraburkholderia sp. BL25I1N1 TaxID=1938804 RepID=UPI000D07A01F|nr:DUF1656 domain-containing protein [Paraburkholderia sp. BL25I1N1]